jgi:peptidoglycan/xylan/chitin deacetylase (PgdA/CDA1 family)
MGAYGMKSTQFIVSGCVNATGGECTATNEMNLPVMSQSQISAMQTGGHEIGSHTAYHHRLTEIPAGDTQLAEIQNSQTQLRAAFSPAIIDNFSAPYGQIDAGSLALINQYYRSNRSTNVGYNLHENFNPYDIKIQYIMPTTTLAEFQSWIDKAKQDKSWMVLLYHSVFDTNTDYGYNITTVAFAQQMAALKTSNVPVLTNEQALNEISPQL